VCSSDSRSASSKTCWHSFGTASARATLQTAPDVENSGDANPAQAKIRAVVQAALTVILTPICLAVVLLDLGTPSAQKFAAVWLGVVLGYWFK
jgi:hypothetical protein